MALRQDESDEINERVDRILSQATQKSNPFQLVKKSDDLDSVRNAEKNGTIDDRTTSNTDNLKQAEENIPQNKQNSWINNVSDKERNNQPKDKGALNFLKKKGPMTIIISLLIGGGFGISTLFSPSLLLVHVKEMMVEKFNTQLTSMDIRTKKVLTKQINSTTSGVCGKITILCKYSSMSEKQIANFEKAGINVIADDTTKILGRKKPTGFVFEGKTINASEFVTELNINPKFRSAIKIAYNPKLGGFTDSIWKKAANYLRIKKTATSIEGENFDEKIKNVEENIKESTGVKESPHISEGELNPETNKPYTEIELESLNKRIDSFNDLVKVAGTEESSGVVSKIMNGASEAAGAVKLTGFFDSACTVYRTFNAISYAAKTVRVIQLASYAMMFLNIADQIKAGVAKPNDVSFLGDILTKTSTDDYGNNLSATDSVGYKYAAYGETPSFIPTNAIQYMAAANVSGFMAKALDKFPSTLKNTCRILGNPIVGFLSFTGGVVLAFFTAGTSTAALATIKVAVKAAVKSPAAWAAAGLALGEMVLPSLLKDIVAGNLVDETTVGANAGNALSSGAAAIMGTTAKYGGNAPLTPEQAVAYNSKTQTILADYAEEDRLARNPFDISSGNTYLGNIVSNLIPYLSKMQTIPETLSSVASISLNPLSFLTPQIAKAATVNNYSTCKDYGYRDLNIATDPFCNVIYGIPVNYLDKDPIEIANEMIDAGQIDPDTGDAVSGSEYSKFIENCTNRLDPLGDVTSSSSDGSECVLNSKPNSYPANFYLYSIDRRVEAGMESY